MTKVVSLVAILRPALLVQEACDLQAAAGHTYTPRPFAIAAHEFERDAQMGIVPAWRP
jgi:hypothetical protein